MVELIYLITTECPDGWPRTEVKDDLGYRRARLGVVDDYQP